VVEQLPDMPTGTLGFRLSGKLSRDEYFTILEPGDLEHAKAWTGGGPAT